MRMTPSGDLYVNDNQLDQLVRIAPDGGRMAVLDDVDYPNGMEVDALGRVYFTEPSIGRVSRYDPRTGERETIAFDLMSPSGLALDPTFQLLYIGNFAVDPLWTVAFGSDGAPGEPVPWATGIERGTFGGMAVDECGNVYVCEYEGRVRRIAPDGKTASVIFERPGEGLHNLHWGRGSWGEETLYVVADSKVIYAIDVGVRGKHVW
jgi:sugar lactone lactonase YvrE